jgi:uncharacterized C2H2 Zn-finger protein
MRARRRLVVVPDSEIGDQAIRESTRPPGEAMVAYDGNTDLYCGRCNVLLAFGTHEGVPFGNMLLRCPSCRAVNDPWKRASRT